MSRINPVIDTLRAGAPIFGARVSDVSHAGGLASAGSWADWLMVEMEHRPYDIAALAAFMRGHAEGRMRSGRAPAITVTLPLDGTDAATIRANSWMIKQVLATGVHGLMLCHAETPEAVRTLVEFVRYSTRPAEPALGLGQGRRGHGGQDAAAAVWGLSADAYIERADIWPLNPDGELIVGIKVENPRALENAEATLAVPGVTYAEWGPADVSMAHGRPGDYDMAPALAARARVKAACAASGVLFLNHARPGTVTQMIDDGVRFITCSEESATIGRAYLARGQRPGGEGMEA
jgi:4-hydroxy-2-oxoheptanedioate aldolase